MSKILMQDVFLDEAYPIDEDEELYILGLYDDGGDRSMYTNTYIHTYIIQYAKYIF